MKDIDFRQQMLNDENRFVAKWISENQFSDEARHLLDNAEKVYRLFYANLHVMATHKWKIETWDAGWYQIRRCLSAHNLGDEERALLSRSSEQLALKILPQIETLGFLDKDDVYEKI